MRHTTLAWFLGVTTLCASGAHAQSNVGELLEKGGFLVDKEAFTALLPLRMEGQWPNRQGEEVLFFSVDGKITGKGYHYASRSFASWMSIPYAYGRNDGIFATDGGQVLIGDATCRLLPRGAVSPKARVLIWRAGMPSATRAAASSSRPGSRASPRTCPAGARCRSSTSATSSSTTWWSS